MEAAVAEEVFPGAVLLVAREEEVLLHMAWGVADLSSGRPVTAATVFDLASLTKPLATALAVAWLVDQGRLDLDLPVATWLPALAGSDKAAITPRQLLEHRSGLPPHRLFYMTLRLLPPLFRKASVLDLLIKVPLANRPGSATLYSDLGYMLLCRLVEQVDGSALDRLLVDRIYGPMGIRDLFFVDLYSGIRPNKPFAATELCPVRNRLLIGEVHDDNAWFAGGVDGHAGLFGTAEAILALLHNLAAGFEGRTTAAPLSRTILKKMLHGNPNHHFSLGFDRPSAENSSAGRYFSTGTVGHLGFTGVSFWMDLQTAVTVILLTNRVHPFRWQNRLAEFRPRIHDRIMEHFGIQRD